MARQQCQLSLLCPVCQVSLQLGDFEAHCIACHRLDPRYCCVWCFGIQTRNCHDFSSCFRDFTTAVQNRPSALNHYHTTLKRSRLLVQCPACPDKVMAVKFELHCRAKNHLNPKRCCVWCFGKVTWEANFKNRYADHLIFCFRNFLFKSRMTPVCSNPRPRLLNRAPLCPPRDFMGHENLSDLLPDEAFDNTFKVLNHQHRVDFFEDPNLNAAASYVRLFVEHQHDSEWFHVTVKVVAFQSFLDAVLNDKRVRLLPFSCWCDGGHYEMASFRQHRHMIVVSRGHFEDNVWNRVKAGVKPAGGYQAKMCHRIVSAMHLVNVLGYVCKRESTCNLKVGEKKGPPQDKHFYIFETLPVDYLLPLCVQWEGGIMRLLHQEKFQNISATSLDKDSLVREGGKWKMKIKDFYGFEGGWVLPMKRGYAPTLMKEAADCFVYLGKGKKLYFKYAPENENLDDETWLRRQVEGGNCFYEGVGEELWKFRKRDQQQLNNVMAIHDENKQLESENEMLKNRMIACESENEKLNGENETLKDRMIALEDRMIALESEIENLKEENKSLKRKHKDAQKTINANFYNSILNNNRGEKKSKLDSPSHE